jgi:hypothetical protein
MTVAKASPEEDVMTATQYEQHITIRSDHSTLAVALAIAGIPLGFGAVAMQNGFNLLIETSSSFLVVLVFVSPSVVGAVLGLRGMYQPVARSNRTAAAFVVGAIGASLVLGSFWLAYLYTRHEFLSLFN